MSIITDERIITSKIREYCDNRDITCGVDSRKVFNTGIIKYVFCRHGSPGFIVELHLREIKSVNDTVTVIYNYLNREFGDEPYCMSNVELSRMVVKEEIKNYNTVNSKFGIRKVIFNNPATIVFWEDGTKTVVKRQKGDRWDKEKGIAMAIAKKLYGNTGKYCDILKEHLEV